jgi:DNA-binding response OmpR family regulator
MPGQAHTLCDFNGLRALVVEDQYLIARHVCRLLRQLGCEPIGPAPNLATAFETEERETLDCALLDVSLGDELVYPFAEELRRRAVPYLFVTGYDQPVIAEPFRSDPHLGKPFGLAELNDALTLALRYRVARSSPPRA